MTGAEPMMAASVSADVPNWFLQFDVRAGLDQRAHQLEIVVGRGPHDRRRPIRSRRVRVRALGQQPQRGGAIAMLGDASTAAWRLGRGRRWTKPIASAATARRPGPA